MAFLGMGPCVQISCFLYRNKYLVMTGTNLAMPGPSPVPRKQGPSTLEYS